MHRTPVAPTSSSPAFLAVFAPLLLGLRPACRQERTWRRVVVVLCGMVLNLGRQRLSQVIVTVGHGAQDWTAWYRLFNRGRVDWSAAQGRLVAELWADLPAGAPLVVGLDATQLPRTGTRMPGIGWGRNPFNPAWKPGIWRRQRWVGLSGFLPCSPDGMSRAVPLRFQLAPSPTTTPGITPCSEWQAGVRLLSWLRQTLTTQGQAQRPVLALGDGAYANAKLLQHLPAQTWLLARCAKNRRFWQLPGAQPQRGRKRRYGAAAPTPQERLTGGGRFQTVPVAVRGRTVPVRVQVAGPLLVRPVPQRPLFLLVVKGVKESASHRRRTATFLLVTAVADGRGGWCLPRPLAEVLGWAWQRWELEVLHRAIKSGFGLGHQQQWSVAGATDAVHGVIWLAGALTLSGYRTWGWQPVRDGRAGKWWRPPRWTLATCLNQLRAEVWQLAEFQPVWARSPDRWGEMERWFAVPTNPLHSYQRN